MFVFAAMATQNSTYPIMEQRNDKFPLIVLKITKIIHLKEHNIEVNQLFIVILPSLMDQTQKIKDDKKEIIVQGILL